MAPTTARQHRPLALVLTLTALAACSEGATEHGSAAQTATAAVVPAHALAVCGDAVPAHAPDALADTEHGYSIEADGNGIRQSPINIRTREVQIGTHRIEEHYVGSTRRVENKGHTVQLDYEPGSWVKLDGARYEFVQFHFHTPSEHHVDGMTYPLELHLVHRAPQLAGGDPRYLVVGVLFREGRDSSFISRFLDRIPEEEHQSRDLHEHEVDVVELIGSSFQDTGYYHYTGSLTTPPFTETVQWLVLERAFEAGPGQIQRLNRLEGNNARHIQAVHGRQVDINLPGDGR